MLILTEKPSVAQSFSQAFNAKRFNDFYQKDDVFITYCFGHLFQLVEPEYYNPDYKTWKLENLPIIPKEFIYTESSATSDIHKHIAAVLQLLKGHNQDKIIIATDADREGELIARIVLQEAGITDISNCFRFWVSQALTKDVVMQGLKNVKPLKEYNKLCKAGFARQHADWLIGMNFTRFVSINNPETFPVGRVQTSVLCEIAKRNYEVKNFVPTPYNELQATIKDEMGNQVQALLINPTNNKTSFEVNNSYFQDAYRECQNKNIDSSQFSLVLKTQKPEKLLNLNELQKKAYKQYGYNPDETLAIAQQLYDELKVLSYPRTPSRVMGEENVSLFISTFNLLKSHYLELSQFCNSDLINENNKHIFNSAKLEAHHALIPLDIIPSSATEKQKNIYNIVVKSFFTVCMTDFKYNEKTIIFTCNKYKYKSIFKETLQEGFTAYKNKYDRPNVGAMENNEIQTVSAFNEKNCKIESIEILNKKTQSKKEYSIDTLLTFMDNPKDINENEKLVGIGTPATRAEIIKKLFKDKYVIEEKKKLFATQKALWLLNQLSKDKNLAMIANVNQTTFWENELENNPDSFEQHIIEYIKMSLNLNIKETYVKDDIGKCPKCKRVILESEKSFYCTGNKEKLCDFVIWKLQYGTKISINDVKQLIQGKDTNKKNCKTKDGKEYKAKISLDDNLKTCLKFDKK